MTGLTGECSAPSSERLGKLEKRSATTAETTFYTERSAREQVEADLQRVLAEGR